MSLNSLNSLYKTLREALLTFQFSVFTFHFISCQKGLGLASIKKLPQMGHTERISHLGQ